LAHGELNQTGLLRKTIARKDAGCQMPAEKMLDAGC
jgi:hypothetical protein